MRQKHHGDSELHNRPRRRRFARTPLWVILTLFLTLIMLLLTAALAGVLLRRSYDSSVRTWKSTAQQTLSLKMENLENCLDDLSAFSILPCFDSEFYRILGSTRALTSAERDYAVACIRTWYYSRRDIADYEITLLNQDLTIGRSADENRVHTRYADETDPAIAAAVEACLESTVYAALTRAGAGVTAETAGSTEESGTSGRIVFSHIIQSFPRRTDALVQVEVSGSALGLAQTGERGEQVCLYNTEGQLLLGSETFADRAAAEAISEEAAPADASEPAGGESEAGASDSAGGESEAEASDPAGGERAATDGAAAAAAEIEADGKTWLTAAVRSARYGVTLAVYSPMEDILREFRASIRLVALEALLLWAVFCTVAFFLIRSLTRPLSELMRTQRAVGEGNLAPAPVEGSFLEMTELSESFGEMTRRIDGLISQNYASRLNEKSARLAALEAQVNPHFLYNTLQAIGAEALVNDQQVLYDMLTSLAENLRYSIKGGTLVPLRSEMEYVLRYVRLMKLRLEERLRVETDIDEAALDVMIPKISIQTLVENSIVHGMRGTVESVHVRIRAACADEELVITVSDTGAGIEPEELANLRASFRAQTLTDAGRGIGLANLYHRLRILYEGRADLTVDSRTGEGSGTTVTMRIRER